MMNLTPKERKWINDVQALLHACPSERLGFFTIGDHDITVYDRRKESAINDLMGENDRLDFPGAVYQAKAETNEYLVFPACVHSVAG